MKSKLPLQIFIFLMAVLLFNTGGGCDQTQLTGDVIIPDKIIMVDEPVALQLTVPESLSGIYRVYWQFSPDEAGEMVYGEALDDLYSTAQLRQYFGHDEIDPDRFALFIPAKPGLVDVEVFGYYKQTNPQPITAFSLDVSDG